MPSLQSVKSGGRTYWRIVESRRVNGKPRPVPILYLGTVDALLKRLVSQEEGALRVRSMQHGDVAALKNVADDLGVVDIIDRHVGAGKRGTSVGTTLLLSALNRAIEPRSKRGWAEWAEGTSLPRLFPGLKPSQFTSQYFWDQMDKVSLDALRAIEDELTQVVVRKLGLRLDTLFYDTTNFFSYIASTNQRNSLAKRGKNKQHRADLRQFSLALLVSRDGQLPLCSHVYEGNRVDVSEFPGALTLMRERLESLAVGLEDVTLVYDKGNNSRANQALVDQSRVGYVASLVPTQHSALVGIPVQDYGTVGTGPYAGTKVLRKKTQLWGAERTVVLFISDHLRDGQRRGLQQSLTKALKKLTEWQRRLERPRSGPRDPRDAALRIREILAPQFLKRVLRVSFDPSKAGAERLSFHIDQEARGHLECELFGKRFLITNRHDWSDEDIMAAYRGQSHVEGTFRHLKDDEHFSLRPQFHWTDQKIHVHTFICLLALILARALERTAQQAGHQLGLTRLLKELGRIRLALVLHQAPGTAGRPRCEWKLEDGPPELLELYRALVPKEETAR